MVAILDERNYTELTPQARGNVVRLEKANSLSNFKDKRYGIYATMASSKSVYQTLGASIFCD